MNFTNKGDLATGAGKNVVEPTLNDQNFFAHYDKRRFRVRRSSADEIALADATFGNSIEPYLCYTFVHKLRSGRCAKRFVLGPPDLADDQREECARWRWESGTCYDVFCLALLSGMPSTRIDSFVAATGLPDPVALVAADGSICVVWTSADLFPEGLSKCVSERQGMVDWAKMAGLLEGLARGYGLCVRGPVFSDPPFNLRDLLTREGCFHKGAGE